MEGIIKLPAAQPPPGQIQNLINPPSKAYIITAVVTISLACTTPMVWMRMFTSFFITKRFRWDDGIVFTAWIFFIGYSAGLTEAIHYGAFVDVWNIRIGEAMTLLEISWVEALIYCALMFAVKTSLLVLYKRIFVPPRSKHTWVAKSVIFVTIFNALFYTSSIFVFGFCCTPRERIWNPFINGKCIDAYSLIIGTAAVNVVSDVFMILIPTAVIWKLQLPLKRKFEVLIVFGFSLVCFFFSILRLIWSVTGAHEINQSIALMKIGTSSFGEVSACLLACCTPMVPILLRHFGKGKKGVSSSPSNQYRTRQTSQQNQKTSSLSQSQSQSQTQSSFHAPTRTNIPKDPYYMYDEDMDQDIDETMKDAPGNGRRGDIIILQTVKITSKTRG